MERKHSFRNDFIVGMGGLGIAVAASFQEVKSAVNIQFIDVLTGRSDQRTIALQCVINQEKDNLNCNQNISEECHDELLERMKIENSKTFFLPEQCMSELKK